MNNETNDRLWTLITLSLGAVYLGVSACGGEVFIDEAAPAPGTTNSTGSYTGLATAPSSNTFTGTNTNTNVFTNTLTETGTDSVCPGLCSYIYACGKQSVGSGQFCPGFTLQCIDQSSFLHGDAENSVGCIALCEGPTGPILTNLVDMDDCLATIVGLNSASPDFNLACKGTLCDPNTGTSTLTWYDSGPGQ